MPAAAHPRPLSQEGEGRYFPHTVCAKYIYFRVAPGVGQQASQAGRANNKVDGSGTAPVTLKCWLKFDSTVFRSPPLTVPS